MATAASADNKAAAPAAAAGAGASALDAPDVLSHTVQIAGGDVSDAKVKSSIAVRFASGAAVPAVAGKNPKVFIKIAHKPNAATMDLYKVKGQLQLLLGFAKLPEMALDLDKNTKQFIVSFVPPMLDALPVPVDFIAEQLRPFAAQLKALSAKLDATVGTATFLPITERKGKGPAPVAAAGAAAPNGPALAPAPADTAAPAGGAGGAAAVPEGTALIDTCGARFTLEVKATRDLVGAVVDALSLPVPEMAYDAAAFGAGFVEQTQVLLRVSSARTIAQQFLPPPPPSFWAEHKAIAASVAAGKRAPVHVLAACLAKFADQEFEAQTKARRMAKRAGQSPLPPVKTYLQWPADPKPYYIRIADAEAGDDTSVTSKAGDVTELVPAPNDFVAFPKQLPLPVPFAVISDVVKAVWASPAASQAAINAKYTAALTAGLKAIPAEAKRVVAGLAQKADETLLALDSVQLVLPGGVGVSLDVTGVVDFRVVPWDVIQQHLK